MKFYIMVLSCWRTTSHPSNVCFIFNYFRMIRLKPQTNQPVAAECWLVLLDLSSHVQVDSSNFEALIGFPFSDFQFCRQTHYYPQSLNNTFRQTIVGLFYFGNQIYRKIGKNQEQNTWRCYTVKVTASHSTSKSNMAESPSMSNISWVIPLSHVIVITSIFGQMAG